MKALPLPTPTGIYCYICRDQEVSTVATRLCNERRKPVCPKHAAGCYEDGHGTSELEIPMSEQLPCRHENFNALVEVTHIQRSDSDPEVIYYSAEIKIECHECGQQFEFVGVPCGLSSYQPTVSVGGDKLRVPMVIPGREVPAGLPGFGVRLKVVPDGKAVKQ